MKDCLVFVQNLQIKPVIIRFNRKNENGELFEEIKGNATASFNEKILNWRLLRELEKQGNIAILYSSVAQDVEETSRFDLLDFD